MASLPHPVKQLRRLNSKHDSSHYFFPVPTAQPRTFVGTVDPEIADQTEKGRLEIVTPEGVHLLFGGEEDQPSAKINHRLP